MPDITVTEMIERLGTLNVWELREVAEALEREWEQRGTFQHADKDARKAAGYRNAKRTTFGGFGQ